MAKKCNITDKKGTLAQNCGQIVKANLEKQEKNELIIKYAGKHKNPPKYSQEKRQTIERYKCLSSM